MSKTLNKISAIGLSLTTVVWLSGAAMLLPVASAATAADIQAQINALLATIQALQAQLGTSTGSTSVPTITRDLTVGSKGTDVTALQNFLIGQSAAQWPSGQAATGYFGSVTKTALGKYQASVGISPTAGYFGAKSRAYLSTLAGGTGTGTGTGTGGVVITAPATGLAVSLASDNPAASSLISGAARVEVLKLNFTAGTSGAATINTLKFTKTGVLSDTAINNAYLIEGGKVVTQFSSISGGIITFSGLNLNVNAGQTRVFTLGIDPTSGLTAGNTVSFALASNANVEAVDYSNNAITETGNFPFNGNTMTITSVENPSIATLAIASSSIGTTVYAGTSGILVSQWTLTGANSKVNLKSLKFTIIGSAAKSDLQNVKLMINGTQVGSTLTSVASDGTAYFDLTASPAVISTGSSNMQVYADVMGSPSFDFNFDILNSFDVNAVDSTYNAPISVTVTGGSAAGHKITINQGATTVNAASDTPTGYIAKGGSGTTLAKFNIYAAGEAMKIKFIDLVITEAGSVGGWALVGGPAGELSNISLIDNVGGQVGSTISTITSGTTSGKCTLAAATTITCHFGTTDSPINYIIPANTTRVLSARVDVSTSASSTSFVASLPTMTGDNMLGMTSSQVANSGAATGAALTISTSPLTVAINSGYGNVTFSKGTPSAKIGSFTLTASAAEGINISNLTILTNASSTNFQNLLAKVAGVQIGNSKSTLSGADSVTFSGLINIPAGTSKVVDVYADTLSSATASDNMGTLTTLSSCTGTGATTNSSISCAPTAVAGQSISLATGPSMSIALSSATAPIKQVVMSSTANSLATFRFTETTNVEPIKISQLIITASSTNSGVRASFQNARLYNGTALIGGPVNASTTLIPTTANSTSTWAYVFNLATPAIVPQNGSLELELKADVASNSSSAASSSAIYRFNIASTTTDITALGQSSNTALTGTTMTLSAIPLNGNKLTVVRSKLTLSAAGLGATSARTRMANDDLSNLTFTADTADPITVNTVTLKFQGMAVSVGTTVSAELIDPSTGTNWNSGTASTCVSLGNSCSVVFSFVGVNIPTISAGTSKVVKLRVDTSNFYNAATAGDGLSVFVNTASSTSDTTAGHGVNWGDSTTTNALYLESTVVPITAYAGSFD